MSPYELRIVNDPKTHQYQTQYRVREFEVDGQGCFCGMTKFSEWKVVPVVHCEAMSQIDVFDTRN